MAVLIGNIYGISALRATKTSMCQSRIRETGRFDAFAEDGTRYTIVILTRFVDTSTRAGRSEQASMRYLKTTDGRSVNRIDKGHYQIVDLGIELSSDDPNAL